VKICATADWHVGAGTGFGRGDHGPGSRLDDQEQVLDRIVDLAIDEQCDLFLFAGDCWHRPRPTPWEIAAVQRPLSKLAGVMPVIAIAGNTHDVVRADLPTAMEVTLWDHVTVSRVPELHELAGVVVCTLPWTPPGQLVAARGGGDRDELHREVDEILVDTARGLRSKAREQAPDKPAVLVAHWSVSQASTPTGMPTSDPLFRETVLPLADLEEMRWDAVVLGHLHLPQMLAPLVFYCGSAAVCDWGEAATEHGVTILDLGRGSANGRFVPIEDRPFVTIDFAIAEPSENGNVTLEAGELVMPRAQLDRLEGAVVRVRYTATRVQAARIDNAELERALVDAGAHKVFIQPEIVRQDRARVEGLTEDIAPGDALDKWIETQGYEGPEDNVEAFLIQMRDQHARYLETAGS
jgi:exonuclease SbcD